MNYEEEVNEAWNTMNDKHIRYKEKGIDKIWMDPLSCFISTGWGEVPISPYTLDTLIWLFGEKEGRARYEYREKEYKITDVKDIDGYVCECGGELDITIKPKNKGRNSIQGYGICRECDKRYMLV